MRCTCYSDDVTPPEWPQGYTEISPRYFLLVFMFTSLTIGILIYLATLVIDCVIEQKFGEELTEQRLPVAATPPLKQIVTPPYVTGAMKWHQGWVNRDS